MGFRRSENFADFIDLWMVPRETEGGGGGGGGETVTDGAIEASVVDPEFGSEDAAAGEELAGE